MFTFDVSNPNTSPTSVTNPRRCHQLRRLANGPTIRCSAVPSRRPSDCATHSSTPIRAISDLLQLATPEQADRADQHRRDQDSEDDQVRVLGRYVAVAERLAKPHEEPANHRTG